MTSSLSTQAPGRPYIVGLLFGSFLPAASAESVDPARQTTLCAKAEAARPFSGAAPALRNQTNEARANRAQAELPEFWRKTLAVVTRIRLHMAKAIFPYLHGYRSKGLTDTGANVVLTTQTQRDIFLFHVRLRRTTVVPRRRSHDLSPNQVVSI